MYPHFLAPMPSMMVARLQRRRRTTPIWRAGHAVPRGSACTRCWPRGQDTACEFRTAHDVTLWPLEIARVAVLQPCARPGLTRLPAARPAKGGLRIRLRTGGGLTFDQLALTGWPLHQRAPTTWPIGCTNWCCGHRAGQLVRRRPAGNAMALHAGAATPVCSRWASPTTKPLLPETLRAFSGYRLLQE